MLIYMYIYIYIYIYSDKEKEITTEFTTLFFILLQASGKYEWCTILNVPVMNGVEVLKLNN